MHTFSPTRIVLEWLMYTEQLCISYCPGASDTCMANVAIVRQECKISKINYSLQIWEHYLQNHAVALLAPVGLRANYEWSVTHQNRIMAKLLKTLFRPCNWVVFWTGDPILMWQALLHMFAENLQYTIKPWDYQGMEKQRQELKESLIIISKPCLSSSTPTCISEAESQRGSKK